MRPTSISIANDRNGAPAYVTVTLRSSQEAQAMLGEGPQDLLHRGKWLSVKPIAIGGKSNVVCCRIILTPVRRFS